MSSLASNRVSPVDEIQSVLDGHGQPAGPQDQPPANRREDLASLSNEGEVITEKPIKKPSMLSVKTKWDVGNDLRTGSGVVHNRTSSPADEIQSVSDGHGQPVGPQDQPPANRREALASLSNEGEGITGKPIKTPSRLSVKTKWDVGNNLRTGSGVVHNQTSSSEKEVGSKKRKRTIVAAKGDDETVKLFIAPGIFHPYSLTRLSWDIWIAILLVYTALIVPYSISFASAVCNAEVDVAAEVLSWLVDACFWMDIILNFRTAIIDPDSTNQSFSDLITDWRDIGKSYLKGWFWMDVAGSVPIQLLEMAMNAGGDQNACAMSTLKALRLNKLARLAKLLKLLRLVRLARWSRIINKAKDSLSINPGYIRLFQGLLIVFVIAHVIACMVFGVVEWEDWSGVKTSWASSVTITVPGEAEYVLNCPSPVDFENDVDPQSRIGTLVVNGIARDVVECRLDDGLFHPEAPSSLKYLCSLYLAFTTMTTVGYGDITMVTTSELIFAIIMMSMGATTFAVMVGQMAALLGSLDIRATAFKERMEDLDDFMHQESLPLDLRFRTRAFFEYGYANSRDIPTTNDLSASLRTEIALHLYNDLITAVPFFRDCGKEFLTEVILTLKPQTLSPGDYLYEAGEYGDSMFFLIKGSVEVEVDAEHGVYAELKEGSYLGETCVLGLSETRPVSVRAMNWCNLFCLEMDALERCLARYPDAQVHFRRLAVTMTAEKAVLSAIDRLVEIKAEDAGSSPNKTPHSHRSLNRGPSHGPRQPLGGKYVGDVGNGGRLLAPEGGANGTKFGDRAASPVEPPVVTRALLRSKKMVRDAATSVIAPPQGRGDPAGAPVHDPVDAIKEGERLAAQSLHDYFAQAAIRKLQTAKRKAELKEGISALESKISSMIDQCLALKGVMQPATASV